MSHYSHRSSTLQLKQELARYMSESDRLREVFFQSPDQKPLAEQPRIIQQVQDRIASHQEMASKGPNESARMPWRVLIVVFLSVSCALVVLDVVFRSVLIAHFGAKGELGPFGEMYRQVVQENWSFSLLKVLIGKKWLERWEVPS